MKTRRFLKYLGLGMGTATIATSELSAAEADWSGVKTFCAAVGFTGAMGSSGTDVATICNKTDGQAAWVNFVKGGALLATVWFGFKGSGISDKHQFDIKTLAFAGAAAALALQYESIMKVIAGFFAPVTA